MRSVWRGLARALAVFTLLALSGCAPTLVVEPSLSGLPDEVVVQHHPGYDRAHHTGRGFRNVHDGHPSPSGWRVAGWVLGRPFAGTKGEPPAVVPVDPAVLQERPERFRATWIGHGTVFVQTSDLNILIDPVFSHRVSPFSFVGPARQVALPAEIADLPGVDAVLISHDHYDHLDRATVRALAERFDPVFYVPLGLGPYVRSWGARRVAELDWWQYVEVDGYRFTCTPAEHNSGRRLVGRDRTLWAGWFVERVGATDGGLRLFYGGDTGYGTQFTAVRERLGVPDVAVLPVGAYAPRWMMAPNHITPEEALQAFLDLGGAEPAPGGRHMIPMHWGTFALGDEPLSEPPVRVRSAADGEDVLARVHLLTVGGMVEVAPDGSVQRFTGAPAP